MTIKDALLNLHETDNLDPFSFLSYSPDDAGSYKICYFASDSIVFKFASDTDTTIIEKNIYETAWDNEFNYAFAETYYFPIKPTLIYNPFMYEEQEVDYLVIQQRVVPLPEDKPISYWWERFLQAYGSDELARFHDFLDTYHIYDLHGNNLGFTADGKPIIFDYLA